MAKRGQAPHDQVRILDSHGATSDPSRGNERHALRCHGALSVVAW
jgi:hypothetical protein